MVTMIVPIYNMERYLSRCVDSLLRQSCRDFEIILVNDGSSDGTAQICDRYAAQYPDLVRVLHKPNGGPSAARNAGLDAVRGEFVIFPDPDDWVEPDYVESLLSHQRQYDADMVCVGHYIDTDEGCAVDRADQETCILTSEQAQRGLLLPPGLQGFSWSKLYRMDIIRAHELRFQEDLFITEDLYFAYCYLPHCRNICYAPSVRSYHYCQSDDSITADVFSRRKLGMLYVMERIIADCEDRDPELAQAARDVVCTSAVNLLWMLKKSDSKDPETIAYLRRCIRQTLPGYLRSGTYGNGRKIQAILAMVCPELFMQLKNMVRKAKGYPNRQKCENDD